jgi:hypothetical protein
VEIALVPVTKRRSGFFGYKELDPEMKIIKVISLRLQ